MASGQRGEDLPVGPGQAGGRPDRADPLRPPLPVGERGRPSRCRRRPGARRRRTAPGVPSSSDCTTLYGTLSSARRTSLASGKSRSGSTPIRNSTSICAACARLKDLAGVASGADVRERAPHRLDLRALAVLGERAGLRAGARVHPGAEGAAVAGPPGHQSEPRPRTCWASRSATSAASGCSARPAPASTTARFAGLAQARRATRARGEPPVGFPPGSPPARRPPGPDGRARARPRPTGASCRGWMTNTLAPRARGLADPKVQDRDLLLGVQIHQHDGPWPARRRGT